MTAFIIKSGISMVLLFGLYYMNLRKEKLFIFNRYYLIFSVLFSLTVPFISIPVNIGSQNAVSELMTVLNYKPELNPIEPGAGAVIPEEPFPGMADFYYLDQPELTGFPPFDLKKILLILYLSGLMLMLVRFCRNILLVRRMYRRSERNEHEGYKIALLDYPVNPFSFLSTVFLNRQDYLEKRIAGNVLRHEIEHVRQSHSYDIIFFEMLQIVYWFNPVVFLYEWAARINHEYLADEAVVRNTSDKETYASDLINFITGRAGVPFASGFGQSMIKKRLFMLNTKSSRRTSNIRLGITMIISVLLLIVSGIRPAYSDNQDRKSKKQIAVNDDIVIEEVNFRNPDFKITKALVVIDGRELGPDDTLKVDPKKIKAIGILKDRRAIRKYGRIARNGAVEITTYENNKGYEPDSLYFKPIYTVNNKIPEGPVTIPFLNLYSLSIWTYPIFPQQDLIKRWRTIDIMTRDYYRIRGKVIQKNGEPLPGVVVTVSDNPSRVTSDRDGRFLVEDVGSKAVAELSAEGYEPLYFKAGGMVFKSDLTITLDKKDEPDQTVIWLNDKIRDFSGRWKYNKELSGLPVNLNNYVYDISQYGSDSMMISTSATLKNDRELNHSGVFVFNSVKTEESDIYETTKSTITCSIDAGGQSFSITRQMKSKIGLYSENRMTDTYSLSDDGKQLIIRTLIYIPGDPSGLPREIPKMVFDRM